MAEITTNTAANPRLGLLSLRMPGLPQIFGGGNRATRPVDNEIESPKSPEFVSRRPPTLPPMHLDFASLADSFANNPQHPGTNAAHPPQAAHHSVFAPSSVYSQDSPVPQHPTRPEPVMTAAHHGWSEARQINSLDTPDPAEAELARLGMDGRRRQERRQRRRQAAERSSEQGRSRKRKPPTRFMFCFPWVKSRRMRSQILRCFVSGTFLFVLLAVCKWQKLRLKASSFIF